MATRLIRHSRERHPQGGFWRQFNNWRVARDGLEAERQRLAFLNSSRLPQNPAHLLEPVRVRVLRPFGLGFGKRAEPGKVIQVERHLAVSMQAINKCELLGN